MKDREDMKRNYSRSELVKSPIKAAVYTNDASLATVKFRVGGAIFTLSLLDTKVFAEALLRRVEEKQQINKTNEDSGGEEV